MPRSDCTNVMCDTPRDADPPEWCARSLVIAKFRRASRPTRDARAAIGRFQPRVRGAQRGAVARVTRLRGGEELQLLRQLRQARAAKSGHRCAGRGRRKLVEGAWWQSRCSLLVRADASRSLRRAPRATRARARPGLPVRARRGNFFDVRMCQRASGSLGSGRACPEVTRSRLRRSGRALGC